MAGDTGQRGGQRRAWATAGILAVALAVRLWGLEARPLWLDEVTTLEVASRGPAAIVMGERFDHHTPPLYYLAMAPWSARVPPTEWWLRLPSVACDLAVILLLGALVRRELGERPALVAAGWWALSPFAVRYAQEARMYPLAAALVVACALAARQVVLGRRPWRWAAVLAAMAAAAAYTHYYALTVLAALLPAWWPELRRRRERWAPVATAAGVAALLYLPWLGVVARLLGGSGQEFREGTGLLALPHAVLRFAAGYGVVPLDLEAKAAPLRALLAGLPLAVVSVTGLLAVLAAGWRLGRRRRPDGVRRMAVLAGVPVLLGAAVHLAAPSLSERYLVVAFPFVVALLAAAPWGEGRPRGWAVAQALGVLGLAVGLAAHLARPAAGTPRWREAAAVVARSAGAPPAVFPGCYAPVVRYHAGDELPVVGLPGRDAADPRAAAAVRRRCRVQADRWWLVEVARWPSLEPALGQAGCHVTEALFLRGGNGLRLLRVEPAAAAAGEPGRLREAR